MNEKQKSFVLVLFMFLCFIGFTFEVYKVKSLIIDFEEMQKYQLTQNSLSLNTNEYFRVDTFLLWDVFLSLVNMMFYLFIASIFYFESKRWQNNV